MHNVGVGKIHDGEGGGQFHEMGLVALLGGSLHVVVAVFDAVAHIVEVVHVEVANVVFQGGLGLGDERLHVDFAVLVLLQTEIGQHGDGSDGGIGDGR